MIYNKYGAYFYELNDGLQTHSAKDNEYYHYDAYMGNSDNILLEKGDSLISIHQGYDFAQWDCTPGKYNINGLSVVLRGYKCGYKKASLDMPSNLPYVNGCSTRQIFPPERIGDPTLQSLTIPPNTKEQMHHIHPTTRIVYVLSGSGYSVVGQSGGEIRDYELKKGMVCILDPMCPHHFYTNDDRLIVIPLHIFSSAPGNIEMSHPMFNGTKEI